MKKLNVQEKSKGVLIFAFNTTEIDYVEIARRCAQLVHHTLKLPVTLVTENGTAVDGFDSVVYIDNSLQNYRIGEAGAWRNGDRFRAYDLTPYDETLLIDSDYLMLDDSLLKLFDQEYDYRIMTHNHKPGVQWDLTMGLFGLQYQWATAVLFKKSNRSKMLFDLVGRIQRNYQYYVKLYHVRDRNFRNDYAFTIANNILNGYEPGMDQGIPWPMLTFADVVTGIERRGTMLTVKEREKAYVIPQQNIHVMDKGYLLSDNFKQFIDTVCVD
jgi:hypothetical protein